MKKNLLGLFLLLTTFTISAQQVSIFNDAFYEVTIPGNGSIESLHNLAILHANANSYDLVKTKRTREGNIHSRYTISNSQFPVKAMELTSHYSISDDETKFFVPRNLPSGFLNVKKAQALDLTSIYALAKNEFPAESYSFVGTPPYSRTNGLIYVPENYDFEKAKWVLAYEIDIRSMEPHFSKRATFNAETGELITVEEKLCAFHSSCVNSTVPGTAVTKYHGTKEIETSETANGFELLDISRGTGIETRDLNNGENLFTDDDNFWDNANAAQDEVAGDVHWGSMATYDYFLNEFGHDGIDGNGMGIISLVHLDIANAFWNGVNATYGDGDPGTDLDLPLTYINIVGHEVAHGVTEFSNGLIYSGESGGLNEGFSDIMGTSIEDYTNPGVVDWLIGEDVSSTGFYFRNMADPKDVDMPSTYGGEFYNDFNGPHTMSSLANKWFQLLVEGGTGTNDNGYEYDVTALGWEKARLIAYNTWTNYLTPNSTYNDCGNFSLTETAILYGGCSDEIAQVKEAWEAVGVLENTSTDDFSANSTFFCEIPATASFNSHPTTTDHMWTFGDGGTSSEANPSHEYLAPGSYTVSLMATNCDGEPFTEIKENYIVLDSTSNNCDTLIMDGEMTMALCNGVIVDNGGASAPYNNNSLDVLTLTNEYNIGYNLTINELSTEFSFDRLVIQGLEDGVITSESVFEGTITAQEIEILCDELVLTFSSDGSVTQEGYIIDFACIEPVAPIADFTSNGPIICSSLAFFTDLSAGPPTSWEWFIDGVLESTEENPQIELIGGPGTYDVQLIACNMLGCDTLAIEDYITYNDTLPFCDTIIMTDDNVVISNNCEGIVVDDGGADGDYSNSVNSELEIFIPDAAGILVTIDMFESESCCDDLTIYRVTDTGDELVTVLLGSLPNETFYIQGGHIRMIWSTDGSVTDDGFVIKWECVIPTEPPVAGFDFNYNGCSPIVDLLDTSSITTTSWEWYLDEELVSEIQNPTITLDMPGIYDITLIACNVIGCDTLTLEDIINYDPTSTSCDTIIMTDGLVQFVTKCEGTLIDDGGLDGDYANNVLAILEVDAADAAQYEITIESMQTESCCDDVLVEVWDGTNYQFSALLAGNINDEVIVVTASRIRFTWDTDGSVTDPGFVIHWTCLPLTDPPTADFELTSEAICYGNYSVQDNSTGVVQTWEWQVDGEIVSNEQNPNINLPTQGTYDLTLIVCNDLGCDTLTQSDLLVYDSSAPECSIVIMQDDQVLNLNICEGTIFDDGGENGNYSNSFNGTVNFENTEYAGYFFDVRNFLSESGFDQLVIREGNTLGSLSDIFVLTGSETPFTFVTSTVFTQFQFTTDGSVTNPGYEIDFQCIPLDGPPVASIAANVANNCSSTFDFTANSPNGDTFEWNFGDGNSDTGQQVSHTYATTGPFTVELMVTNDFGDVTTTLDIVNNFQTSMHNAPAEILINTVSFVEVVSHPAEDILLQNWFVNDVFIHSDDILDLSFPTVSTNTVRCDVTDNNFCVTSHETIVEAKEVISTENEELASQISIFPNPTTGELTVTNLSLFDSNVTITVTNAVGQLITRQQVGGNADVYALDISSATSGIYFVSIQDDQNKVYKKITKIK